MKAKLFFLISVLLIAPFFLSFSQTGKVLETSRVMIISQTAEVLNFVFLGKYIDGIRVYADKKPIIFYPWSELNFDKSVNLVEKRLTAVQVGDNDQWIIVTSDQFLDKQEYISQMKNFQRNKGVKRSFHYYWERQGYIFDRRKGTPEDIVTSSFDVSTQTVKYSYDKKVNNQNKHYDETVKL